MRGSVVLPALLGLLLAGSLAWAAAPSRVGLVSYATGEVSLRTSDAAAWALAVPNYPLAPGSTLRTASGARAEVQIGSSFIRMDSATQLDILALDDATTDLRLPAGSIEVAAQGLAPGEQLQVSTPGGSASLLVTSRSLGSYRVDVWSDGSVRLVVRDGRAEVTSGGSTAAVTAGQAVLVSPAASGGLQAVAAPQPDAFDQWMAGRDQLANRVAASGYVSPAVVGAGALFQYGVWGVATGVGPVWFAPVTSGWSPSVDGHWVMVQPWGWTWISKEPWGFAPFHYGSWMTYLGQWVWVPGSTTYNAGSLHSGGRIAFTPPNPPPDFILRILEHGRHDPPTSP